MYDDWQKGDVLEKEDTAERQIMINSTMTIEDRRKRAEWNRNRLRNCAESDELTEVQHTALAILSSYRHQMHCGKGEFFKSKSGLKEKFSNFITYAMPIMLRQAGLPPLYLETNLRYMPDDEMAEQLGLEGEYLELAKSTCEAEAERLNRAIEGYLAGIDRKADTWYAPSGMTRENNRKAWRKTEIDQLPMAG